LSQGGHVSASRQYFGEFLNRGANRLRAQPGETGRELRLRRTKRSASAIDLGEFFVVHREDLVELGLRVILHGLFSVSWHKVGRAPRKLGIFRHPWVTVRRSACIWPTGPL